VAAPFPLFEGKYEIITKLKEGGMGAVYKVRHRLLDEVRVIKLIRPQLESDEAIRARFLREARTAVRLRHPNIAQFYDFSMDEEGNAFIVMEFIEGFTLEEMITRVGPPSLPLGLEIAEQSLQPIGYLHRRSTIHRDVSPDNLMLSRNDDGFPLIKLIDLGIAKVLEEEGHSQITRRGLTGTGMFLGKVRYASPEQFHAQEGVSMDARSDLYSFGLVLYELLTGTHPIRGSSVPSFIAGHLFHPPVPFSESDPEGHIPEDLRAVVLRSLAKAPEARFASAEAFIQALAPIKARFPLSLESAVVALDSVTAVFTEKTQVGSVGSTQARIDRQFGIAPTPPPVTTPSSGQSVAAQEAPPQVPSSPPPAPPLPPLPPESEDTSPLQYRPEAAEEEVPPGPSEGAEIQQTRVLVLPGAGATRITELVEAARELVGQGRWSEALERLTSAQGLDPGNTDVAALWERATQGVAAEAERARLASARAAHARRVEDLLDAGQLEPARQGLEEALAEVGRDEALEALLERLAAAEEAQAAAFRQQAEDALAAGALEDAVAAVQQAIALRPDEDALRDLLQRVEATRERRRAIDEAAAAIAAALAADDRSSARHLLDDALARLGEDDVLVDLKRRLERAEATARVGQARGLCALGKEHLQGGRLAEARASAEQALALLPDDLESAALLADLKAGEERLAAERRAAEEQRAAERYRAEARVSAEEGIRHRISQGLLSDAADATKAAREKLGDWAGLEAVERELEDALQQKRLEQTSALLVEAQQLSGAEQYEAAEAKLVEAELLSPTDERVLQALIEVRGAVRRWREAQERSRAVVEEMEAVARALDAGSLEEAAERFDSTVRKYGDRPELGELRRRLREARRAEEKRRSAEQRARRSSRRQPDRNQERAETLAIEREDVAGANGEPVAAPELGFERAPTRPVELVPELGATPAGTTPGDEEVVAGRPEPLPAVSTGAEPMVVVAEPKPLAARAEPAACDLAAPATTEPQAPTPPPVVEAPPPARRRWPLVVGLAVIAVVAVIVGVAVWRPGPAPGSAPTPVAAPPTEPMRTPVTAPVADGVLVVTATPWGEIVSVKREDGLEVSVAVGRTTPVRLTVPAGHYTVTVRDPATRATSQQPAVVVAGQTARVVVAVRPVGTDDLLKRFGWSG